MKHQHFLWSSALALWFFRPHHSCSYLQTMDSVAYYMVAIWNSLCLSHTLCVLFVHAWLVGHFARVRRTTITAVHMHFNLRLQCALYFLIIGHVECTTGNK